MSVRFAFVTLLVLVATTACTAGRAGRARVAESWEAGTLSSWVRGPVRQPDGSIAVLQHFVADGHALSDADVLLGVPAPDAEPSLELGERSDGLVGSDAPAPGHWAGGVIPFVVDDGLHDPARVLTAIRAFEEGTPYRFVERTDEADHLHFRRGDSCSSYVGRVGGAQPIFLSDACDAATVLHELGHAIGLHHEHQRSDRGDHVEVHVERVSAEQLPNLRVLPGMAVLGEYDPTSIMHASSSAFGATAGPPVIALPDGEPIARARALSDRDVEGIARMFASLEGGDGPRVTATDPAQCELHTRRIRGDNRFATAVAVGERATIRTVAVVVNGASPGGMVDAQASAPFASQLGVPVLLTEADRLPEETRRALSEWATASVVVVGGVGSVSDAVVDAILAETGVVNVERIGGATRVDTAVEVARRLPNHRDAFLVSSANDALPAQLIAASAAARLRAPLLLTDPDALHPDVEDVLAERDVRTVYVIGELAPVVLERLPDPRPILGRDPHELAANAARTLAAERALDLGVVHLVSTTGLADGIAASARSRALLFTDGPNLTEPTIAVLADHGSEPILVGGDAAIGDAVFDELVDRGLCTVPEDAAVPCPEVAIGPVPEALRGAPYSLDAFYQKHVDVDGIPLVGSAVVSDGAFIVAADVVRNMLASRPDIRDRLIEARIRVGIIARSEVTTSLPEHSDLNEVFPTVDWDTRTRGVGATAERPLTSVGEENLLGLPEDVYAGESILVHELSHTVFDFGLSVLDPGAAGRLDAAFAEAGASGWIDGTYRTDSVAEYWAEGAQDWFDANLAGGPDHNEIDTREEIQAVDPALSGLLREAFGEGTWRPLCVPR